MGWFQILIIAMLGYGALYGLFDLAQGEKSKVVKMVSVLLSILLIFLSLYFLVKEVC